MWICLSALQANRDQEDPPTTKLGKCLGVKGSMAAELLELNMPRSCEDA